MAALRLCKSIGDHCAKYTDDRETAKEARQNFIAQIQTFITFKRTTTIIDQDAGQQDPQRTWRTWTRCPASPAFRSCAICLIRS